MISSSKAPFFRQAWRDPLAAAFTGLLLLILLSVAAGLLSHNYTGEEFSVLHYADNFDHLTAWTTYFNEIGSPVAVTYWTYLYESFGYNPPVARFFSFILLLLAASAATLLFRKVWPRRKNVSTILAVLLLLFFSNGFRTPSPLRFPAISAIWPSCFSFYPG